MTGDPLPVDPVGPAEREAAPAARAWRRAPPSALAALLAAGTFLLYLPVAGLGFIRFDDPRYLTENPVVQRGLGWDGLRWALGTLHVANWHPLTWLSHMLDVQLFGMAPGPHHLVNAAIHAVNAALLLGVLARMTGAPWRSAFVAALFAVHPLHVESVAWIAERKDVLSTLFGLLSLAAYASHAARPRGSALAASIACFALSLLAKPMWVTLPFLLLLLDHWPLRRIAGRTPAEGAGAPDFPASPARRILLEKAPFLALALASSAITVVAQDRGGALSGLELPLADRVAGAAVGYVQYVAKLLWPSSLSIFYPYGHGAGALAATVSGAAVLATTGLLLARASRLPWAAVGWCWFAGTLVPVIGIVQVGGQAIADRYTYFPSVGLFVAIAWGAHRVAGTWRGGVPLAAAGVAVVALLAGLTLRQLPRWRTSETLFRHALAVTEDNALAHGVLSDDLRAQGRLPEAVHHAREAVRIDPGAARHWTNLAVALREAGLGDEARDAARRSVALNPRHALGWRVLGMLEHDRGDPVAAVAALERAVALAPGDASHRFSLGLSLAALRPPDAIRAYEEAVRLAPGHFGAWTNLAALYQAAGRTAEAGAAFDAATRADPGNPAGWRNLGVHLARAGRPGAAVAAFGEALRLRPGEPDLLFRLGLAQLAAGAVPDALATAGALEGVAPERAAQLRALAAASR